MNTMLTFATADSQPISSSDVSAALHSMFENPFLSGRVATDAEKAAFLPVSDNVSYDDIVVGDIVFMYDEDDDIAMVGYVSNTTDETPDKGTFYKQVEGDDDEPDIYQSADTKVFVIAQCPDRDRS